jgi:NAD-dependent aldehyde dehydrogenases
MQSFQHYIDGQFENGKASFESIDPATGEVWALMPAASAADVARAVEAAARALLLLIGPSSHRQHGASY